MRQAQPAAIIAAWFDLAGLSPRHNPSSYLPDHPETSKTTHPMQAKNDFLVLSRNNSGRSPAIRGANGRVTALPPEFADPHCGAMGEFGRCGGERGEQG